MTARQTGADGLPCAIVIEESENGPTTMQQTFDRAAEDLGNAIHLEHVNVSIRTSASPRCSMAPDLASPAIPISW